MRDTNFGLIVVSRRKSHQHESIQYIYIWQSTASDSNPPSLQSFVCSWWVMLICAFSSATLVHPLILFDQQVLSANQCAHLCPTQSGVGGWDKRIPCHNPWPCSQNGINYICYIPPPPCLPCLLSCANGICFTYTYIWLQISWNDIKCIIYVFMKKTWPVSVSVISKQTKHAGTIEVRFMTILTHMVCSKMFKVSLVER